MVIKTNGSGISSLSHSATHSKQKVAMAAPERNEHCLHLQKKSVYNIPRACFLNRSAVPGMVIKTNRSGISSLSHSATQSKQKVAMAAPEDNENCHCVQNDPQRHKIKLERIYFNILWCYGAIKESFPRRRNPR